MEVLWVLIPVSLLIVLVMGGIFWWSVKNGQFDDLDGPAYRILVDDDAPKTSKAPEKPKTPSKT